MVPMKVYKNLQEFEDEGQLTTKSSNTQNVSLDENTKYFSPFSYDYENINIQLIMNDQNTLANKFQTPENKRKRIFTNLNPKNTNS